MTMMMIKNLLSPVLGFLSLLVYTCNHRLYLLRKQFCLWPAYEYFCVCHYCVSIVHLTTSFLSPSSSAYNYLFWRKSVSLSMFNIPIRIYTRNFAAVINEFLTSSPVCPNSNSLRSDFPNLYCLVLRSVLREHVRPLAMGKITTTSGLHLLIVCYYLLGSESELKMFRFCSVTLSSQIRPLKCLYEVNCLNMRR